MKNNPLALTVACILVVVFCPALSRSQTSQLTQLQQPSEIFSQEQSDQRMKALDNQSLANSTVVFTARFLESYKDPKEGEAAAKKMGLEFLMGSMTFISEANVFWRDGKVQEQVLKDYLSRIKLVPQATEDEWSEALIKVNGGNMEMPLIGKPLKMPMILGAIIVQDRLFNANGFKPQESKKLLARISLIPQDAIEKWSTARKLATYQAAISLINMDSLFVKEAFQQQVFAKKLEEATKGAAKP